MKKIVIAVTDFARPAPLKGSIETNSGLGRSPQIGQEIHQRVQQSRAKTFMNYEAEVSLSQEFTRAGFSFEVCGRMDGLFSGESPRIEEIKTSFNTFELLKLLRAQEEHPYLLQLKTYGYFYWLQHQKIPQLNLHLVSSRNFEALDFQVNLNILDFEKWLELRLDELVEEVKLEIKREERRKKAAQALKFPFATPRSGQIELIQTIEKGLQENTPMLLQAPTGLGKTMGVLYPNLKESLERGQRVIYVTPKNSQHAVAEEAIEKLQDTGAKLKSLTITAKSKMCLKNEPLCNPEYCEYAKDHYTKVAENKLLEQLAKKKSLKARTFKKMAIEFQVCPFELQLDAAREADTVICDYNYVFAPRSAFGRLAYAGLTQTGKPNLVIDEAHNLPARTMDYYSPSLSSSALGKMREDAQSLNKKFRKKTEELIDGCLQVIRKCADTQQTKAHQIKPPVDLFLEQDQEIKSFLSQYLAADIEIKPKDVVLRLSYYWSEFTANLEYVRLDAESGQNRFFTTFSPNPATVKITCCDASDLMKQGYDDYANVTGFSATLKPFDYYSQLCGLKSSKLKTAEFASPFEKKNRKILLIPQISSKYSERERNYPRIAEAIHKISSLKRGNYIAFFPSFEFMNRVCNQFQAPVGLQVLRQEKSMRREDVDSILEILKDKTQANILFAVQGGVFSEGVDYPGEMVIGAFVVGPPLPNFDLEREKMREYYEENYNSGFDYAYTYPAMAKAVQAAGRVIRTETDKGIIVLMDNRFVQQSYVKSMPQDWFEFDAGELVSQSILKDLENFWKSQA